MVHKHGVVLKIIIITFISLFYNSFIFSSTNWLDLSEKKALTGTVDQDLKLILKNADLSPNLISFDVSEVLKDADENIVEIYCPINSNKIQLNIKSKPEEWASTFYYGLQRLGFYFPHPRKQISPNIENLFNKCGMSFAWNPTFKYRGFHLHTMHPNEWVHGFLMDKKKISTDLVRWLARNGQNIFDVSLLKIPLKKLVTSLTPAAELADDFGIQVGYSLSFALNQQNSYKLIPLISSTTGLYDEFYLKRNLEKLIKSLNFNFITLEAGTSEFTSVNYERALKWMESARVILKKSNRKLFMKVHVSSNQKHKKWGNFNFLPQFTHPDIGVLPHTVMFYGLFDQKVPMYGNKNFSDIYNFTIEQNSKRSVWYYPETSYWIAMDMDAPLFLTDYLVARAQDMKELSQKNIEGHFNFTSGHENGYWLFDWTIALNTNKDYHFDPFIGLKLLGEDETCWRDLVNFQTKFLKEKGLISILSFPNLQDELSKKHRIHERNLLKELKNNSYLINKEINSLDQALSNITSTECIINEELKTMMQITELRIHHALNVRLALKNRSNKNLKMKYLDLAKSFRMEAKLKMDKMITHHQLYPEARLYERQKNPTSYSFGYLWPASQLHFWELEEKRVLKSNYNPFFMNIYNMIKIIF